jgi:hypothetical protein
MVPRLLYLALYYTVFQLSTPTFKSAAAGPIQHRISVVCAYRLKLRRCCRRLCRVGHDAHGGGGGQGVRGKVGVKEAEEGEGDLGDV